MAKRRREPLDARLPEIRLSHQQLERWRRNAAYARGLSFSEWLRMVVDGACTIEENARRTESIADERFRRLGAETPLEQRERRRRGEDDWPEVEDEEP